MSKRTLAVPRTETTTDVWLTPKFIIDAVGPFSLDPCHNLERPFETAEHYFTEADDGLKQDWTPFGTVWLNSPYGAATGAWLSKLAAHGNGIALVFAKTETEAFKIAWRNASAILFLGKRIQFLRPDGTLPDKPGSGAGSALIAFGDECARHLETCGLEGALVKNPRWIEKRSLFEVESMEQHKCPSCGQECFTVWRSDPVEVDLSTNTKHGSGCESQTEVACRGCGYIVDANDDFDLHGAIMKVVDEE